MDKSTSAKWISTQVINIVRDAEDASARGSIRQVDPDHIARVGARVTVSRLKHGTAQGSSVAILQLDLDDGTTVVLESTLRQLHLAVDALRTMDIADGGPGW